MDVIEMLQQLGFTEYEARAYVALLRGSPQTGYELALSSGLPRPNVYSILPKLEKRGAIVRMDSPDGTRYAPVPPEELLRQVGNRFQTILENAQSELHEVSKATQYESIWNVQGYAALLEHARAMLDAARASVLIAVEPVEAAQLAGQVSAAVQRGVKVTTLCLESCASECGNCRGRIFRYHVAPLHGRRWLVLVVDGEEMLAGQIESAEQAQLVRTRQAMLVDLAAGYIRRSTALGVLLNDLGERLDDQLSPAAREALAALSDPGRARAGEPGDWLEQMRALLQQNAQGPQKKGGEPNP